jgi:hypothetical protein
LGDDEDDGDDEEEEEEDGDVGMFVITSGLLKLGGGLSSRSAYEIRCTSFIVASTIRREDSSKLCSARCCGGEEKRREERGCQLGRCARATTRSVIRGDAKFDVKMALPLLSNHCH